MVAAAVMAVTMAATEAAAAVEVVEVVEMAAAISSLVALDLRFCTRFRSYQLFLRFQ